MITNNLNVWEAAIKKQFLAYQQLTSKITGGHQIALNCAKSGLPFVTVNFYPGTHKLMIQPGKWQESNLLNWLGFYSEMKKLVCDANTK